MTWARWWLLGFVAAALIFGSAAARANEVEAKLTLDAFSFLSFEDEEFLRIPAGGSIRVRFGSPAGDGSVPITIRPEDFVIPAIPSSHGLIRYSLARDASGVFRQGPLGYVMEVSVVVKATAPRGAGRDELEYPLTFTTGSLPPAATGSAMPLRGKPVGDDSRHVQLVAATVNPADAEPSPGGRVYVVLSGTFDELPELSTSGGPRE